MLRCNEVTRLCASEEIDASPFTTRLGFRLHLILCRHCRRYVRELARIGEAVRALGRTSSGEDARNEALVQRVLYELNEREN